MMPGMRALILLPLALIAAPIAAKDPDYAGRYRLAEGPDVAGQLELTGDGKFAYMLAAGALDERAEGRWELKDGKACLTTEPTPRPPEFQTAEPISGDGATVRVTWPPRPDGTVRGIPGIDFTIGFDEGDPVSGYTQEYGWTMPPDEARIPRWIELTEPIHRIKSPRLRLTGRFRAVLQPNDLGVVDFQDACLEQTKDAFMLHRPQWEMKFRRAK